jgi:N-acetyl-anhydromuramyl-L-alanine amidase AmpD
VAWPKGTDQTDANMQTHASDPNKIKQLIDQLTSEGYGINESVVKG